MADLDPVDRKIIFEVIFSSPEAGIRPWSWGWELNPHIAALQAAA
jgi:hypothetical protein